MRFLVLCSALMLPLTALAQAQPQSLLPPLQTAADVVKPGTWVRYTIYNRRTHEVSSVRIAALQREGKGQWVEVDITDQQRRTLVYMALVEGSLAAPGRVLRTVVQPPGLQPVEIPPGKGKTHLPPMSPKPPPGARLVGRGPVKVAAGTFTAAHHRGKDPQGRQMDIWSSNEVHGWPMIKAATSEILLELTAHGDKARSRLQGKPAKLDPELLKQLTK